MMDALEDVVIKYLSPDLLHPKQRKRIRKDDHPSKGHCYVVSEAIYHLFGHDLGFEPQVLRVGTNTHWYLRNKKYNRVIDLTAKQFKKKINYSKGRYCAFLTKKPSKRAKILLERIKDAEF